MTEIQDCDVFCLLFPSILFQLQKVMKTNLFKKKHWWQHLPNSFAHLNVLIQISIFEVFQPNIGHDWPEIPPPGRLMLKIALCFAAWSSNSSLHCASLVTQPRSSSHWAGFPQYSCSLPIISQYQSWSVHAKMNRKKRVLPGPLFRSYTWLIQINKDNTSSVFYSAFESTKFTEELFVNAFWMKLFFWKLYPQYVGTGTPMVHHLWNILFGCILCQMHCASSK